MTSVKNVMAIASHLQFLESSLSNILIEAALKLTTLTDSSIFILIDGPNGRKYAGTDRLTDAFTKEGLMRENGDAEMNIEGEIRVRERERAVVVGGSAANSDELFRFEGGASAAVSAASTAASSNGSGNDGEGAVPERRSTRKRTHPTPLEADGGGVGGKEKRLTMEAYDSSSEDLVEMESSGVEVYFEPEIGNVHSRNSEFQLEDENQLQQQQHHRAISSVVVGESPPDDYFYDDESHLPETSFEEPSNYYEIEGEEAQPYDYLQGWSLTEYLSENPKAQTLKAINDASIAEKGSVSYKLLTSLLWDVAKEVTDLAPDVKSSKTPFFASLFEELWNYFPCLDSLQNDGFKIKMKEHDYTLKAHLKKTIASCIRHRCVAKNKVNKKVVKRTKK